MNTNPNPEKKSLALYPFPEFHEKIRAGFTQRNGGFSEGFYASLNLSFRSGDDIASVTANWRLLAEKEGLKDKPLFMPKLVHGDGIALTENNFNADIEADAIYSQSSRGILAVTLADCLAALIYDPINQTIAAVHAGWRGTQLKILGKTLEHLTRKKMIDPSTTLVAFGPCLRREVLEIRSEVAEQFDEIFLSRKDEKIFLDMPAANEAQALGAGILKTNIRDLGGCTLEEPERYFSYRRDGAKSGRMAAFISLI